MPPHRPGAPLEQVPLTGEVLERSKAPDPPAAGAAPGPAGPGLISKRPGSGLLRRRCWCGCRPLEEAAAGAPCWS